MGLRNLFRRRTVAAHPADPAPHTAADGWRSAGPVQRTVAEPDLVTSPATFRDSLVTWQNPSLHGGLGHLVTSDAPSGLGHGLVEPSTPESPSRAALPEPARPGWWRRRPVAQRAAADRTTSLAGPEPAREPFEQPAAATEEYDAPLVAAHPLQNPPLTAAREVVPPARRLASLPVQRLADDAAAGGGAEVAQATSDPDPIHLPTVGERAGPVDQPAPEPPAPALSQPHPAQSHPAQPHPTGPHPGRPSSQPARRLGLGAPVQRLDDAAAVPPSTPLSPRLPEEPSASAVQRAAESSPPLPAGAGDTVTGDSDPVPTAPLIGQPDPVTSPASAEPHTSTRDTADAPIPGPMAVPPASRVSVQRATARPPSLSTGVARPAPGDAGSHSGRRTDTSGPPPVSFTEARDDVVSLSLSIVGPEWTHSAEPPAAAVSPRQLQVSHLVGQSPGPLAVSLQRFSDGPAGNSPGPTPHERPAPVQRVTAASLSQLGTAGAASPPGGHDLTSRAAANAPRPPYSDLRARTAAVDTGPEHDPVAAGAVTTVQRAVENSEPAAPPAEPTTPEAAPPVEESVAGAPSAVTAPPGAGSSSPTDVDALVRRLYEPIARRLKAELRLDRERAGYALDLRH